jgi:hypothetical protein
LLVERGWLSAEERGHVEFLLDRKLRKHRGDGPRVESASGVEATSQGQVLGTPAQHAD